MGGEEGIEHTAQILNAESLPLCYSLYMRIHARSFLYILRMVRFYYFFFHSTPNFVIFPAMAFISMLDACDLRRAP